jgi:Flp pilus assembly protein TadG
MRVPFPILFSAQYRRISRKAFSRRGAAAVELAILLPILTLMFVIVVDYARVYFFSQTVENCARAGALYASDDAAAAISPYLTVQAAAQAEAPNLSPHPTVPAPVTGNDEAGNAYVRVTCNWTFHTIISFPGVPSTRTLSRTIQVRKIQ